MSFCHNKSKDEQGLILTNQKAEKTPNSISLEFLLSCRNPYHVNYSTSSIGQYSITKPTQESKSFQNQIQIILHTSIIVVQQMFIVHAPYSWSQLTFTEMSHHEHHNWKTLYPFISLTLILQEQCQFSLTFMDGIFLACG